MVADLPQLPGTHDSGWTLLDALFRRAGFDAIATRSIDVTVEFPDFEAFWTAQTPSYSPTTRIIAAMDDRRRRATAGRRSCEGSACGERGDPLCGPRQCGSRKRLLRGQKAR